MAINATDQDGVTPTKKTLKLRGFESKYMSHPIKKRTAIIKTSEASSTGLERPTLVHHKRRVDSENIFFGRRHSP